MGASIKKKRRFQKNEKKNVWTSLQKGGGKEEGKKGRLNPQGKALRLSRGRVPDGKY